MIESTDVAKALTRAAWNANAAFWDERMGSVGGGRPDLAQAGGKDASKLDEAMKAVMICVCAECALLSAGSQV